MDRLLLESGSEKQQAPSEQQQAPDDAIPGKYHCLRPLPAPSKYSTSLSPVAAICSGVHAYSQSHATSGRNFGAMPRTYIEKSISKTIKDDCRKLDTMRIEAGTRPFRSAKGRGTDSSQVRSKPLRNDDMRRLFPVSIPHRYDQNRSRIRGTFHLRRKFQFLIGTIKTRLVEQLWRIGIWFQFLIGTIKTRSTPSPR